MGRRVVVSLVIKMLVFDKQDTVRVGARSERHHYKNYYGYSKL